MSWKSFWNDGSVAATTVTDIAFIAILQSIITFSREHPASPSALSRFSVNRAVRPAHWARRV
jgi:hypothetical protein